MRLAAARARGRAAARASLPGLRSGSPIGRADALNAAPPGRPPAQIKERQMEAKAELPDYHCRGAAAKA